LIRNSFWDIYSRSIGLSQVLSSFLLRSWKAVHKRSWELVVTDHFRRESSCWKGWYTLLHPSCDLAFHFEKWWFKIGMCFFCSFNNFACCVYDEIFTGNRTTTSCLRLVRYLQIIQCSYILSRHSRFWSI